MALRDKSKRLICLCNGVSQERIEEAIRAGAQSLGRLFDTTTAGAGPCGGSCQPTLKKMLESYAATGDFPENPKHPGGRKVSRK